MQRTPCDMGTPYPGPLDKTDGPCLAKGLLCVAIEKIVENRFFQWSQPHFLLTDRFDLTFFDMDISFCFKQRSVNSNSFNHFLAC